MSWLQSYLRDWTTQSQSSPVATMICCVMAGSSSVTTVIYCVMAVHHLQWQQWYIVWWQSVVSNDNNDMFCDGRPMCTTTRCPTNWELMTPSSCCVLTPGCTNMTEIDVIVVPSTSLLGNNTAAYLASFFSFLFFDRWWGRILLQEYVSDRCELLAFWTKWTILLILRQDISLCGIPCYKFIILFRNYFLWHR